MTTIHDLRNGNTPRSRYQYGDTVIYDNRPGAVNVAQVRGDGNRPQLHLIDIVTEAQAQATLDTGGDWCEDCDATGRQRLATTIVTEQRGRDFYDRMLCDSCEQDRRERARQEHEDAAWLALNDYRETLADALARTGRV